MKIRLWVVLPFLLIVSFAAQATVPLPRENPVRVNAEENRVEPVFEPTLNLQKKFTLEGFFVGETVARGSIFSKTIGAGRSFRLYTSGTWDGKVLTVVETYSYASGDSEERIWRFKKKGDGLYIGESKEILKKIEIAIVGRVATLKYQKRLPRPGGKKPVKVTFHETWTFRKSGVLESRTKLRKFVNVGQEAINFVRVENAAALKAPGF